MKNLVKGDLLQEKYDNQIVEFRCYYPSNQTEFAIVKAKQREMSYQVLLSNFNKYDAELY